MKTRSERINQPNADRTPTPIRSVSEDDSTWDTQLPRSRFGLVLERWNHT